MRPTAVVDDVGQMGVQGDGQKPTRLEWLSHRAQSQGAPAS
jgi:hypothetical protein